MKSPFLCLLVFFVLTACFQGDGLYTSGTTDGSESESAPDVSPIQNFSCVSPNTSAAIALSISADGNTVSVNPQTENAVFARSTPPSENEENSVIEYRELANPSNSLKISGAMVHGASGGSVEFRMTAFICGSNEATGQPATDWRSLWR